MSFIARIKRTLSGAIDKRTRRGLTRTLAQRNGTRKAKRTRQRRRRR